MLITALPALSQPELGRLLPESFSRAVVVTWKQDGRVVDLGVSIPRGEWVLEELVLIATIPPGPEQPPGKTPQPLTPEARQAAAGIAALDAFLEEVKRRQAITVKVRVLPGRKERAYVELPTAHQLSGLTIAETRGRPATHLEALRAVLP